MALRSNIPEISKYTFCRVDKSFAQRALTKNGGFIVGGENYGQGSSREHAALLPMFLGVEAVVAKSFARIHKENLITYGILPLLFKDKKDYEKIDMDDRLQIDDAHGQVDKGEVKVRVANKNIEFETRIEVSDFDKGVLKMGGTSNYLRNKLQKVKR